MTNPKAPTIEEWTNIVQDIYALEKLTFTFKGQTESFFQDLVEMDRICKTRHICELNLNVM